MNRTIRDARAIFQEAVRAVQAPQLLRDVSWREYLTRSLGDYERVDSVGLGKMSLAMGGVLEDQIGDKLSRAQVVIPSDYADSLPADHQAPHRMTVLEGGHPIPNAGSAEAAKALLEQAKQLEEDDLLIVLISGGGTALTFGPAGGISLEDAQETIQTLLEAGADIEAMNTIRKHLSLVGGGQLARAAASADVLALVVSDVVGNPLPVIASGPTVPDPSTFADARQVLQDEDLYHRVPPSVQDHLEEEKNETPKPGDVIFEKSRTELIGTNQRALEAAVEAASERGYQAHIVDHAVTGEAREVGRQMAKEVLDAGAERACLVWGGETTVTVRGEGKGGRNQELALAAALELDGVGRRLSFLSGGTDGIDGPTDAAGAVVTPVTVSAARRQGLDARRYLDENNSYTFFKQAGGLLRTGPTHTNVMDVQIAILGSA